MVISRAAVAASRPGDSHACCVCIEGQFWAGWLARCDFVIVRDRMFVGDGGSLAMSVPGGCLCVRMIATLQQAAVWLSI